MKTFKFKALDNDDKLTTGLIDADNEKMARQLLRDRQLAPIAVWPGSARTANGIINWSLLTPNTIRGKPLAHLVRQLGVMLGSGVSLHDSLGIIASHSPTEIGALCYDLRGKILEGHSLASAATTHGKVFPPMYIASIAAGERAGALEQVLLNLADFEEHRASNKHEVKMALLYPCILLFVSLLIISGLMISVVPGFKQIFEQHNQALPHLTELLLLGHTLLSQFWPAILTIAVGLAVIFYRALKLAAVRARLDKLWLRVPVISKLIRNQATAELCQTLHLLCSSGVPLVDALKIACHLLDNTVLQAELNKATAQVEQGESFSKALTVETSFPWLMAQLAGSGEASGHLDKMLKKTSEVLAEESKNTLATMLGLLQPLILLMVAGFIFLLVIALLQPIFALNSLI